MQTIACELEHLESDSKSPPVEQTDLLALVKHQEWVEAATRLDEVYHRFQTHQQDFCAVKDEGRVIGLCSRGHVGFLMGHRYGFAIYSQHPVRDHLVEEPLLIQRGTPVRKTLDITLSRPGKRFNEDVVLVGPEGEYLGIIPVPALVQLQSALVSEKFQTQEVLHRRLMAVSRQAGMAEVATGVLHNVGNVLNSVNVSATLAGDLARGSKVSTLEKLAGILAEKRPALGDYLVNDPKGKLVPDLLCQLASRLRQEQAAQIQELDTLAKHLAHIKSIVAMQQRYAKVSGLLEPVAPAAMVEDALEMNAGALTRHGVAIERRFEEVPNVVADKHKVLQILVNLIRNAKYALDMGPGPKKLLTLTIARAGAARVRIEVRDNGVGISPQNLSRIFSHGFTTKKDGHGFGLHSSALAAKEMGGALRALSDGLGCGAAFSLELPMQQPKASL